MTVGRPLKISFIWDIVGLSSSIRLKVMWGQTKLLGSKQRKCASERAHFLVHHPNWNILGCLYERKTFTISGQNHPFQFDHRVGLLSRIRGHPSLHILSKALQSLLKTLPSLCEAISAVHYCNIINSYNFNSRKSVTWSAVPSASLVSLLLNWC